MPIVFAKNAREFNLPNVTFTPRAAPSLGATLNSVWQFRVAPHAPGALHQLTKEEIIVALLGHAVVTLGNKKFQITAGDTIIVPANIDFGLANESDTGFEAIAILPVGAQAMMSGELPFTPPWAI